MKTDKQLLLETRFGPLETYLLQWWSAERVAGREPTTERLAEHLGVHYNTLRGWYEEMGFEVVGDLRRVRTSQ